MADILIMKRKEEYSPIRRNPLAQTADGIPMSMSMSLERRERAREDGDDDYGREVKRGRTEELDLGCGWVEMKSWRTDQTNTPVEEKEEKDTDVVMDTSELDGLSLLSAVTQAMEVRANEDTL